MSTPGNGVLLSQNAVPGEGGQIEGVGPGKGWQKEWVGPGER